MLQEGKRIAGKKVIAICTLATEDKSLVLANQINEKIKHPNRTVNPHCTGFCKNRAKSFFYNCDQACKNWEYLHKLHIFRNHYVS